MWGVGAGRKAWGGRGWPAGAAGAVRVGLPVPRMSPARLVSTCWCRWCRWCGLLAVLVGADSISRGDVPTPWCVCVR